MGSLDGTKIDFIEGLENLLLECSVDLLGQFPNTSQFVVVGPVVCDDFGCRVGWYGGVDARVDGISPCMRSGVKRRNNLIINMVGEDEAKMAVRASS